MKTLSVDFLKECFSYDPRTGVILRKARPRNHFRSDRAYAIHLARDAGKFAGSLDKGSGYLVICLGWDHFQYQRIAWALHYGSWPTGVIDHKDLDKTNNRILNLRECTHAQNMKNQKARKKVGSLKGAYWHKRLQKWQASICANYKQHHLGFFDTEQEAHAAYVKASNRFHGKYGRAG